MYLYNEFILYKEFIINIVNTINTLPCPSKSNSKRIELTLHTSCYWGLRLTLCYIEKQKPRTTPVASHRANQWAMMTWYDIIACFVLFFSIMANESRKNFEELTQPSWQLRAAKSRKVEDQGFSFSLKKTSKFLKEMPR